MKKNQELLSKLPKVDEVLQNQRLFEFFGKVPRGIILDAVREAISETRFKILDNRKVMLDFDSDDFYKKVIELINKKNKHSLINVINATGVVLHTNLGRANLPMDACENVVRIAKGYSTLEYDIKKGCRGSRQNHLEDIICNITGAEAAMVVNNNAAATMLCLSSIAKEKQVIVSRGELVEIGGSFRIPEIMAQSGAELVEVGTTNKTRRDDYLNAINEKTASIMKVHTSNYKIVGFTAETTLEELVSLGHEKKIPVIYDMGSGLLVDLRKYGINEPTVQEGLKCGIDVILFSGDKLMGGPQAGIIAGKSEIINTMKNNPLARVVRADKMSIAALESVFRHYSDKRNAFNNIPILKMLTEPLENMKKRGEYLKKKLEPLKYFDGEVVDILDKVGGGSAPATELKGIAVKINSDMSAGKIESKLRRNETPIIARIVKNEVYIAMRTVDFKEINTIVECMYNIEREFSEK